MPKGIDWKTGTCQQLGWPHRNQADIARAWKHILGRVTSFADLEPALLGRVEELIDFTDRALSAATALITASGGRAGVGAAPRPKRGRDDRVDAMRAPAQSTRSRTTRRRGAGRAG